jgi:glucosamine-6-phosphate deaminase
MVPGAAKAQAVYHTLVSDITEQYPSTILRKHPNTFLFIENDSAARVLTAIDSLKVNNYQ